MWRSFLVLSQGEAKLIYFADPAGHPLITGCGCEILVQIAPMLHSVPSNDNVLAAQSPFQLNA